MIVDNWDEYWDSQKKGNVKVYAFIAERYREWIIEPYLSKYIKKHFIQNALLLHAGCGGGQVDLGIANYYKIIPMDISTNALNLYKELHPNCETPIECDIRKIELPNRSIDGVFSLGVMEHFTENDIVTIWKEFSRVLKPRGKIILFWPPRFGLSVLLLKSWHFIANKIFRKPLKLHPDEISLLQSRAQVNNLVKETGLKVIDYHFGINDLFTQVVIVLQKENKYQEKG